MNINPMLAEDVKGMKDKDTIIDSPNFVGEVKLDGVRAIVVIDDQTVRIFNRNLTEITERFPEIINALDVFPCGIYDGEICFVTQDGGIEFTTAQRRAANSKPAEIIELSQKYPCTLYLFDCLQYETILGKRNVEDCEFIERKDLLKRCFIGYKNNNVVFLDYVSDKRELFLNQKGKGAEGIMLKNLHGKYLRSDGRKRSKDIIKWKIVEHDEPFIVGYAYGDAGKAYEDIIGHLVLAKRDKDGGLVYVGGVGGGLSLEERIWLKNLLDNLAKENPLKKEEVQGWMKGDEPNVAVWVQPIIRAKVEYNKITKYGRYQFPEFRGIMVEDHEDWDWTMIRNVDVALLAEYKGKMSRKSYRNSKKYFYRTPAPKLRDILVARGLVATDKKADMITTIANLDLTDEELKFLAISKEAYEDSKRIVITMKSCPSCEECD